MAKGQKTRRKPAREHPILRLIESTCALSKDYKLTFHLRVSQGIAALVQGRAKEQNVTDVYMAYNTAYALAKHGLCADKLSVLQDAYDELVDVDERAIHQRVYEVVNKRALFNLQELLVAQLDLCTIGIMESARAMTEKAVANKEVDWFDVPVNLDVTHH